MAEDVDARVQRILESAERIAAARRAAAEDEAEAYLEAARRRVDAFADGRIRRIRETSDALLAGAEALGTAMQRTRRLTSGVDGVVQALADAAEAVAAEASRAPIGLPRIDEGADAMAPRPLDGASASAGDVVRQIASSLPPRPGRRPGS